MDAKFYVPYETARQLRVKGYPQSTDTWYAETAKGVRTYNKPSAKYESIARPTYHEVLDWILKKNIAISVDFVCGIVCGIRQTDWYGKIRATDGKRLYRYVQHYPTREDALNAAILETLKRI